MYLLHIDIITHMLINKQKKVKKFLGFFKKVCKKRRLHIFNYLTKFEIFVFRKKYFVQLIREWPNLHFLQSAEAKHSAII